MFCLCGAGQVRTGVDVKDLRYCNVGEYVVVLTRKRSFCICKKITWAN